MNSSVPGPAPPIRHYARTRAMIKIQDGCDNRCSFCIIPEVRGAAVGRSLSAIRSEAEALRAAGERELVLTGVNMARWRDGAARIGELLQRLVELPGTDYRIRLSSLEPGRHILQARAQLAHPRVARHLHVCLQSGSPRILRAMRRSPDVNAFRHLADQLRHIDPLYNLTTDVIIGFPGETEDDFQATLDVVREIGYTHVHAFPYSPRPGTAAAAMTGRVPGPVIRDRAARLREVVAETRERYLAQLIGAEDSILVEPMVGAAGASGAGRGDGAGGLEATQRATRVPDKSRAVYSEGYIGRYVRVRVAGLYPRGSLVPVRITGVAQDRARGRVADMVLSGDVV